jgi:hypothetical protein
MLQKVSAQKVSLKKDTVYFLVDTAKVPVKDRMFIITKEEQFMYFRLTCKCYPWQMNPMFTYGWEHEGFFLSKKDFNKIRTISISELIEIVAQYGQDKIKKTIFYIIEPDGKKWRMHETFLMPPQAPTI